MSKNIQPKRYFLLPWFKLSTYLGVIFKPVIVPLFKLVHPVLHSCFGGFFPDQMVSWYCVLRTVSYFCIISHFQYIQMCFLIIIIFSSFPFCCVLIKSVCRVVSFLLFL